MVTYNEYWTYLLLFFIIFSETGLVIFPFFPGDALLITVGVIAATGVLNVWILIPLLAGAAILGNTSNYFIGKFAGARLLKVKNATFQRYIENTNEFYEKHGGRAVLYSRFFPILRTYVPFVAGVTTMDFREFTFFNILGGIVWVLIFVLGSYLVADIPFVKNNFEKIFMFIMFLTLVPFLYKLAIGFVKKK